MFLKKILKLLYLKFDQAVHRNEAQNQTMQGVNKVILMGYLGKDPELRYMEGNIAKARFTLATTETYQGKEGQKVQHTEWHLIVLWRTTAENASKILKKGSRIYLEGKLQTNSWTDKTGHKKNITEIIGENFILLQKNEPNPSDNKQQFESNISANMDDAGLPY